MTFTDLHQYPSLQFIPVNERKQPIPTDWQKAKKQYDLRNLKAVGLVCGKLSGGVEAIDIDCKYDLTGKLFDRYKRLIHEVDNTLLEKLVVQKTKSGGYHFIYRCSEIAGNLKLARRPATADEKQETFKREYKAEVELLKDMPLEQRETEAKKIAIKRADNDKVRVLIETRGEGGQIVCHPSPGYTFVHGSFETIHEITPDQRETLFNIARQFDQTAEEYKPHHPETKKQKGVTPFEDYNERGDVVGLLINNGWKEVKRRGGKIHFLRPGQTSAATSGNYDVDRKWFTVFTTSSQFEPQKAYLPYAVYAILECGSDFTKASRQLYEAGYGDRLEKQKEVNQTTPSRVSLIDDDFSFIAGEDDYEDYLEQARAGTLPMGLTTGMPSLDKHFLFKQGAFVIINGFDNVGKTSVILFMCLLSSLLHKWRWIVYCAENTTGSCMRKLIEFYWNKSIRSMNDVEYKQAKEFIKQHFTFIKSEDDLYNYKDILLMTKKLQTKSKYDAVLVDPYNALKIELTNTSKLSTHEYHYEAISEIKQYTRNTGCGFWINTHAVTGASRLKNDDKKTTPAPGKADVEGGQKWANKADEFITIHRHTQDPEKWMVTELHVRKVKEIETGGRMTAYNAPVEIRMMKGGFAFCENQEGIEESPIEKWHKVNKPRQRRLIEDYTPDPYRNEYLEQLTDDEDPF